MTRLTEGDSAPSFTLLDDTGRQVSLSNFRGKTVVLYAYPRAMTPGCTTESCDFRDSVDALSEAGVEVVGISPDQPKKLAQFREKESLNFTLLSDPERETLTTYGAFGEKKNYGKTVMGVIRSTFVIDAEGNVAHALYNVRAKGHVGRVRDLLGI